MFSIEKFQTKLPFSVFLAKMECSRAEQLFKYSDYWHETKNCRTWRLRTEFLVQLNGIASSPNDKVTLIATTKMPQSKLTFDLF